MWWKKAPFIRILPALIGGILLQKEVNLPIQFLWVFFGSGIFLITLLHSLPIFGLFRFWWLLSFIILSIFFTTGALLTWYNDVRNDPRWYGHDRSEKFSTILTLLDEPVPQKNSWRVTAATTFIIKEGHRIRCKGKLYVYFDSSGAFRKPGEQLLITKHIDPIQNSGNPGSFDFQRFSLFNGITGSLYLRKNEYRILGLRSPGLFFHLIETFKKNILATICKYIPGQKERGLAEALLIGYKNDLDKDLSTAYANTGTVHIIAISGMHLGLIYGLLLTLLKPLGRRKVFQWLQTILILFILWAFSFLCGAQPSILRSTFMFSFILVGKLSGRSSSAYNSLAASAFLLLCMDPFSFWDIGFQLSYAAVTSILLFYKPISSWYYSENKLIHAAWDLIAISIAAQILTMPIAIFHFHQFPVLFILANIIAVPLSGVILLGEILLYLISFVPWFASLTGKTLSLLIGVMDHYIQNIDSIPGNTITDLQIIDCQLLLCFCIILLLVLFIHLRRPLYFFFTGYVILLFLGIRVHSFLVANSQEKIVVYNIPGHAGLDLIAGRQAFFIGDMQGMMEEPFKAARSMFRIEKTNYLGDHGLFEFKGKLIGIIERPLKPGTSIQPDLLVIKGKEIIPGDLKINAQRPQQVVIDASVPARQMVQFKRIFDSLHIPCHSVRENGAFVMSMR
jgi:competence protein ComEC